MAKLPPQPVGVAPGSSYWNDWYEKLRLFVDRATSAVDWSIITGKPTTLAGYGITDSPVGANPTASIGLTVVNGAAGTFMRSDAAPALSVAISPTWTGTHTFSNPVTAASYIPTSSTIPTNGLYLPAANSIAWSTNSTQRVRVISTGEVGLGITPVASIKLQVFTASNKNVGVLNQLSEATIAGLTDAGSSAPLRIAGNTLLLSGNGGSADHVQISSTLVNALTGNVATTTVGRGFQVKEGANAKMGTSVLVAGAVTVANTAVTATSRIFVTSQVDGGTPGFLRVSARVAATSFTITSSNALDTSTVAWIIFEPS